MKEQNLDHLVCAFGGTILQKHLDSMKGEIEGVKQGTDIEYIHRMRVASRRFRNALEIFSGCFSSKKYILWQEKIRSLTRALGAARDLDVQIFHIERIYEQVEVPKYKTGIRRLLLRLRQRRQKQQQRVLSTLDLFQQSNVLNEIEQQLQKKRIAEEPGRPLSSNLYRLSNELINSRLDALYIFEPFIHKPECKKELHAMRIAAKHFRYSLETFSILYPGALESAINKTRKLQENLGEIHDRDVWIEYLPQFLELETKRILRFYGNRRQVTTFQYGILYLEDLEEKLRNNIYKEFLATWEKWEAAGVWDQLRSEILVHLPPDQIYPPQSSPVTAMNHPSINPFGMTDD